MAMQYVLPLKTRNHNIFSANIILKNNNFLLYLNNILLFMSYDHYMPLLIVFLVSYYIINEVNKVYFNSSVEFACSLF